MNELGKRFTRAKLRRCAFTQFHFTNVSLENGLAIAPGEGGGAYESRRARLYEAKGMEREKEKDFCGK